jgi:hypothetical protein
MSREEFFDSVRNSAALATPAAATDHPGHNPIDLTRALRRAAIWLTPKSVEGFDPHDFEDLDPKRRQRLEAAVRGFRDVAGRVPANAPATDEQAKAGWSRFEEIAAIVRQLVRDEWVRDVSRLVGEAEAWSGERGWVAKRMGKTLKDKFLGAYEAPQLLIHTTQHQLLLDPVARYVPGASGLLDLAVLPSYESVMITRADGKWSIHPVGDGGRRREWSERAFVDAVTKLSARA